MATFNPLDVRLRDRKFYLAATIVIAVLAFLGFAPTFYLNSFFAKRDLPLLYIAHGTAFSAWIVLLITQSALISAKQVRIHRKLGYAGGGLVLLMLYLGLRIAIASVQRGFSPPGAPPPLIFMVVPFFDLIVFAVLVGSALWYRNRPEIHKRLMVIATLAILPAATARLFLHFTTSAVIFKAYALSLILMLACMAYDFRNQRRVHAAYLWSVLFFLISVPLRFFLGGTAEWLRFAHWLTGV